MLKNLYISNYTIIDELEVRVTEGLNIITGETGAGKSILTGALSLILGARADSSVIQDEEKNTVVEGEFDISAAQLEGVFSELDLPYDSDLLVRRILYPSGRSRAFVNDHPISLQSLKSLMSNIVQQHRQFDTLDIGESGFQLQLLDALCNHEEELDKFKSAYLSHKKIERELQSLREEEREMRQKEEFLRFRLEELNAIELEEDEEESILAKLSEMENSEEIKSVLHRAEQLIFQGENAVVEQLRELSGEIKNLSEKFKEGEHFAKRIESCWIELEDLASDISGKMESIDYDDVEIQELREKRDKIYSLLKKHNVDSGNALLTFRDKLKEQLRGIDSLSEDIAALEKKESTVHAKLLGIAEVLSKNRGRAIPKLEKKCMKILEEIAMPHARLEIQLNQSKIANEHGIDQIDFLFSANTGMETRPIKEVASGGELSRLALALKSIVAEAITLPTMIFDEIDQGVSGDVSLKVGHLLKNIASHHQLLLITHSAQIAAMADRHFYVYKEVGNGKTFTRIKKLNRSEREHKIAELLSQAPPSKAALVNAKELIRLKEKKQ